MVRLNKKFIDNLPLESNEDKVYWDDDIKGFGLRIQGKSKSWLIMYRNNFNKQKKLTIGKTNKITPEEARNKAKKLLADITLNELDPALEKTANKKVISVNELCNVYMQEGIINKKPSTIENDKSRIERHVKPLIGNIALKELRREHIDKMVLDIINGKTAINKKSDVKRGVVNVTGGKAIAKRTLEMLSSILAFAKLRGYIEENPALGVPKPKANKRTEFLTIADIKQLGKVLDIAENQYLFNTTALNIIKLLVLTGCRKTEITSLRWQDVDLKNQCFRFKDTKTGSQIRPFGIGAKRLLEEISLLQDKQEWVFSATRGGGYFKGVPKVFNKLCEITQEDTQEPYIKENICLHTLRHSFASVGADMGYNELTIAGLLGHRLGGVTNRYSHNVDSSLVFAADKISIRIEQALKGRKDTHTAEIIDITRGA